MRFKLFICILLIFSFQNTANAAPTVGTFDCEFKVGPKPTSLYEACGDGNTGVTKMKWNTWGSNGASGVGLYFANDCKPYCAKGKFHYWRAHVELNGLRKVGNGFYLSKLKWWQIDAQGKKIVGGRSGGWDSYDFYKMMSKLK